jgi:hypothetical protein
MNFAVVLSENLLSPMVLFFVLGIVSGLCKSDLEIPEQMGKFLAIYLIVAIGFKGGISFAEVEVDRVILTTIVVAVMCGFIIPFLGHYVLRLTTNLAYVDAVAVSAHYGSISVMTFLTAASFLRSEGVEYQGFIVGILAIMEVPAIIAALLMVRGFKRGSNTGFSLAGSIQELMSNGSVLLLVGSMAIGYIVGEGGGEKLQGLFVQPFYGMLSLFLLDMGLRASKQSEQIKTMTPALILFGMYVPLFCGAAGLILAWLMQLDFGTGLLFGVLMGSASYIAVPATLKVALPEANPGIYLPLSLGITFPFNIVFGIPIYYLIAQYVWSW